MGAMIEKMIAYRAYRRQNSRWHVYASHAGFYVTVSSIPAFVLTVTLASGLLPENAAQLIELIKRRIPGFVVDSIPSDFFANTASAALPLVSFSAAAMLWTSTKGLRAIFEGLRAVYGSEKKTVAREYARSLLYTVLLFVSLLAALTLLVFGNSIYRTVLSLGSRFSALFSLASKLGWLFSFALFTLIFVVLYRSADSRRPLRAHLPGALAAALGWILYSAVLSLYLNRFPPRKYLLYGSLGALLLLMLWVRSCMKILLLGAEFNVFLSGRTVTVFHRKRED